MSAADDQDLPTPPEFGDPVTKPDRQDRPRPGRPPGRPQSGPFLVRCPAGRYAHCQCQRSGQYPYCDGSHRSDSQAPRPLKVVLDQDQWVSWCACGASSSMPFCDGSHGTRG